MKKIFISLLFFLSTAAIASPSGWKLSRDVNGVKVWQLEKNSDVTGSLEKRKTGKKINWLNIKQKDFFKKLEEKKKKMLSFIGISEWKGKYKWQPKKEHHELLVNGSYRDWSGQKITFAEVHIYRANETIQILHTRPTATINGDKLASRIIAHMKNQAGVE